MDKVKDGMVVAADVFDHEFGGELPVIARGVVLSNKFIEKLKKHGIAEITIAAPHGYSGSPGEVLAPTEVVTKDITFNGSIELYSDVPPDTKIEAGENITINGNIEPGCSITSAGGEIIIVGKLTGSDDNKIALRAATRITIKNTSIDPLTDLDIRTLGDVVIDGDITDSTIAAKGRVRIEGAVTGSRIYSQTRIKAKECGDNKSTCMLLVKPWECRDLFQEVLALDKQNADLRHEQQQLQNTIDLVHKLSRDIATISDEESAQLARETKRLKELSRQIESGQARKDSIMKQINEILRSDRIIISHLGNAKTTITIENFCRILDAPICGAAFFVRDMQIETAKLNQ